jgi:hypothetical protein
MKSKKGLKYYATIFGFSTTALVLYVAYLRIKDGEFDTEIILPLLYVPVVFTGFLFAFDRLFEMIFPGQKKVRNNKYNNYIQVVGDAIDVECDFGIEDYKKLRNSQRFQKGMEQAFRVYDKGETDDIDFEFLEKKFRKSTNEYIAFQVVIKEVKKMMENS